MPGSQRRSSGGGEDPPLRSTRRNSQADRDFIQDNRYDFRVQDDRLVYTGVPLDFGNPFQLPPDESRCTYSLPIKDDEGKAVLDANNNMAPLGRRCPNWGVRMAHGRTLHLCIEHVPAGAEGVRRAVKDLLLQASLALTGRMITNGLDPATPVRDQTAITNSTLDRIGVRAGVEISAEIKGYQKVFQDMMENGEDNDDDQSG